MKKLLLAACVAGVSGMVFGQTSFRMADTGRMGQEDGGRWYVSPGGGFMWWEADMNVKRTGYATLRLGTDLNDTLSLEFGGLVAPMIVDDPKRAREGRMRGGSLEWRGVEQIYGITADALMHLNRGQFIDPYFRLGMGMWGATAHIFGDNHCAWVPRAGLGVNLNLTDNLAFRAEGLYNMFVTDDLNSGGSVELGLVYSFGGGAAAATPASGGGAAKAPGTGKSLVSRTEEDNGNTIRYVYDLQFAYDSAVINPAFFNELDQAVDALNQNPGATASIEGHTDQRRGSGAVYNRNLSQQRADNVLRYITGKGVAAGRLNAKGFGFDMPKDKAKVDLVNGNPENRRVEIIIRKAQ